MARWDAGAVNSHSGPGLAIQTTYEQRYLRAAIQLIAGRLPSRSLAVEFGAGYGRLTPVLEDYFDKAIGLERERELIELSKILPNSIEMLKINDLASVPIADGMASFSLTCTLLQHLTDSELLDTINEMKRITQGGFILLVENTIPDYMHGDYGVGNYFTKGRTLETFCSVMDSWILDFVRPRNMGNVNGQVWGSFMMFRDVSIKRHCYRRSGIWDASELRF